MNLNKKIIILVIIFLFPILHIFSKAQTNKNVTITILYNNVPYDKDLTTAWGMSCLIEGMEKTILFDAGGEGTILLSNMETLGINPKQVDIVLLSHIHGDHVGGLWNFLEKNNDVVYLPKSFPKSFKLEIKKGDTKVVSVDKPIKICKDTYSTGELGWGMKEQSLLLNTEKGIIVITGCAHPGIVNIVRKAIKITKNDNVYLVLGGFHLMAYSEKEVKKIIKNLKELKVKKVGPSHCTGGKPIELFKRAWGDAFFDLGCGAKIKIEIDMNWGKSEEGKNSK